MLASDELIEEMKQITYLKSFKYFFFSPRKLVFLKNFAALSTFVINIWLIASLKRSIPESKNGNITKIQNIGSNTSEGRMINLLIIIQIFTVALINVFWLIIYSPIVNATKWKNYVKKNQFNCDNNIEEKCNIFDSLFKFLEYEKK